MVESIIGKTSVGIVIFILILAGFFSIYHPYSNIDLNKEDDKIILLNYAYEVLDSYFTNNDVAEGGQNLESFNFDYHKLFITFICNGKIRACQSGSADNDKYNRLFLDVKEATVECVEDDRFGGVLLEEELPAVEIVFNFLFNKMLLKSNDFNYLEDNIELGIHAIEVSRNGKSAYFKESVPISKNYDLEYTLERLCKKAGLDDDSWMDDETSIYKYDTLTFIGDRENNIVDLFRYNILVDIDDITNDRIFESISLGKDWFLNSIDTKTNLLEYKYYPSKDSYSSNNNHVRQLGSLWSITELDIFLGSDYFDGLIKNTLDYYLDFKNTVDNYAFLTIDGYSKLAYNAFMTLILVNTPDYTYRDELLIQFAEGILYMQNDDGSYNTYFMSEKNTGVDFYPGEAMLGLMKLFEITDDNRYIESVEKAFPYYREYWRSNKNTAFIPWHTQVYWLLFQETGDSELAEFIFEMNDWIIANYQIQEDEYLDKIGGFPKSVPRYSTSSYIEGINDAYAIALVVNDAEHIDKYRDSLRQGVRFILQTQFTSQNSFYLENPVRAIGGFKESLISNDLRNDFTQHAVMALIKAYQNQIFK